MAMIFQNLLDNALKYQSKNNHPEINISFTENPTSWTFTVQDNGIGIKEEYLESIFEPFKRLHNQSDFSGSGLGLSACKKIIENLNGQIKVESEPEKGTSFIFSISK